MTDTSPIVVAETPTALPKSTTADDLLQMYSEETPVKVDEPAKPVATESPRDETPSLKEEAKSEEVKPETTKEVPPLNKYKAKIGDENIEIAQDAEIVQQINGKDVPIKVKDAIEHYVKKEETFRTIDRRLSVVDRKEKELQGEYSSLKGRADQVVKAAMTGDLMSCVRALAKIAAGESQLDVVAFEKAYLDQIEAFKAPYASMTEEQRAKFFAERKAKVYEEELKRRSEDDKKREALGTLQERIDSVIAERKIEKQEFWETFKAMADSMVGPDKELKDANELSPEDVAAQVELNHHAVKVKAACDKAGLDDAAFDQVFELLSQHLDLTEEQVEKIIKDSGINPNQKTVEDLNRRLEKSKSKGQFTQASSTKKNGKVDGLAEEDISFLYRNQPRGYKRLYR